MRRIGSVETTALVLWVVLLGIIVPPASGQGLSVHLRVPASGGVIGDVATVVADISSEYEITHAEASFGERTTSLAYGFGGSAEWGGLLVLEGLTSGTGELTVVARNAAGGTDSLSVPVTLDRPPKLTGSVPAQGAVIGSELHLSVECLDEDPAACTLAVLKRCDRPLSSAVGSHLGANWLTSLDISELIRESSSGTYVEICLVGEDAHGQRASLERRLFVETSSMLDRLADFPGAIADVSGDLVTYLVTAADGGTSEPRGFGIAQHDGTAMNEVQFSGGHITAGPYLTDHGAVAIAGSSTYWLSATDLVILGPATGPGLSVAGDWVAWTRNDLVYRARLPEPRGLRINLDTAPTRNTPLYVNREGWVVFDSESDRHEYREGVGADGTTWTSTYRFDAGRLTDGLTPCSEGSEPILAWAPVCRWNGLWVAYMRPGTQGQDQVWVRYSPHGTEHQVSLWATDSRLESLAPDGRVTFTNRTKRYLGTPGGRVVEISSSAGMSYWEAGRFYISVGNTLFALPVSVSVASDTVLPDEHTLGAVYPNPATSRAWLDLDLRLPEAVTVEIFDVMGRRIGLESRVLTAGAHSIPLPVRGISPGAYLVRVTAGEWSGSRSLILMR